jgi:hypothetical protein
MKTFKTNLKFQWTYSWINSVIPFENNCNEVSQPFMCLKRSNSNSNFICAQSLGLKSNFNHTSNCIKWEFCEFLERLTAGTWIQCGHQNWHKFEVSLFGMDDWHFNILSQCYMQMLKMTVEQYYHQHCCNCTRSPQPDEGKLAQHLNTLWQNYPHIRNLKIWIFQCYSIWKTPHFIFPLHVLHKRCSPKNHQKYVTIDISFKFLVDVNLKNIIKNLWKLLKHIIHVFTHSYTYSKFSWMTMICGVFK